MARPIIKLRKLSTPTANDTQESGFGGGVYFSSAKKNFQFVRSGCTMLDCILGGGWVLGRFANLIGDSGAGKSALALEAVANFFIQYPKGYCRYNEAESALDPDHAEALGIPMDRVDLFDDCRTVENFMIDVDKIVNTKRKEPTLYIVDSLDGLSDNAEMERDIGEKSYGSKAKLLHEFFRRLHVEIKETNMHLLVVSQVKENIGGGPYSPKHIRSGGKSLDFYASQIVWLYRKALRKEKHPTNKAVEPHVTGVELRAKCTKNRIGLPFRECEFDIGFGYGVEDWQASEHWLKKNNIQFPSNQRTCKDVPAEELRQYIINKWFEIEKTFLPTKRKYA